MYLPPSMDAWKGRIDSDSDYDAFRWHQRIEPLVLADEGGAAVDPAGDGTGGEGPGLAPGACLIGFACDEGVRRNVGRPGAVRGPEAIRAESANLPCDFEPGFSLYDAGDVTCDDGRLEDAQALLGAKVRMILDNGLFPIVLGGGHETAFGHWLGQREGGPGMPGQGAVGGIVNFDAHLDMRPYPSGGSSGTMFRQIADILEKEGEPFRYLCVGVQRRSNTMALFRDAEAYGARWLLARDIAEGGAASAYPAIDAFLADCGSLMVTICADVLSSAWAPGVSAPQPLGLDPETVLRLLKRVLASGKARGLDISELSPRAEGADPTASLAATLLFAAVNAVADNAGLGR